MMSKTRTVSLLMRSTPLPPGHFCPTLQSQMVTAPGNGQTVFDFESALSDISDAACEYCGLDLNAFQAADGITIHPDCAEVAKLEETHPWPPPAQPPTKRTTS
jgi:hypothetical protein